ncbi:hypothetical protein KV134_11320 [Tetragenococcus halophilus]|uniref:Uncharacterized protein n=2 Tax=Tetragenococcus halophilus TaxID=51669 RepID=A0A2H6DB80_TETHA|nr:hypothetical protein [Tetragenococcus halophilus]RQD29657.1 hypothetical protein C7K42_12455 [Tetragenococcus halophilus subsp. halophilus DSM 20339]NRR74815.1 hypothetical protein [Tetragenococcus halophilus]QXN86714.1 hypothetical protein KV134_11320 [Tetragenococcus halophilus]WJS81790.1 hypothetical protein KFZ55_11130 [Tetragenococcus halophilus]BAK95635.1 hypothetical protein TEH_23080 [Tetragenococcus halophilus NBRC 12172]
MVTKLSPSYNKINTIAASQRHSMVFKSGGTIVAIGWNKQNQCNVNGWYDIVAISMDSTI